MTPSPPQPGDYSRQVAQVGRYASNSGGYGRTKARGAAVWTGVSGSETSPEYISFERAWHCVFFFAVKEMQMARRVGAGPDDQHAGDRWVVNTASSRKVRYFESVQVGVRTHAPAL